MPDTPTSPASSSTVRPDCSRASATCPTSTRLRGPRTGRRWNAQPAPPDPGSRVAWQHGRMNKATWAMLNESEKALLRQAEASSLARLDEDELIDLHTRVRRARKKYAT